MNEDLVNADIKNTTYVDIRVKYGGVGDNNGFICRFFNRAYQTFQ